MATNNAINVATAATGKVLRAQGIGSTPLFSTATYPDTSGTSGNLLTSDGTNFISAVPATFSQIVTQVFTASGIYTPSSGMKWCVAELVGGGGGGGGVASTSAVQSAAGGGGASGQYTRKSMSAATIGASQTITIGTGGTGGTTAPSDGGAGVTSVFGAIFQAAGGAGGKQSIAISTFNSALGGVGSATGGAGDFNSAGAPGENGLSIFSAVGLAKSGAGGSSFFGGGGLSRVSTSGQAAGNAGLSYGGGGSGAVSSTGGTAAAGGAGFAGICVITEYI